MNISSAPTAHSHTNIVQMAYCFPKRDMWSASVLITGMSIAKIKLYVSDLYEALF